MAERTELRQPIDLNRGVRQQQHPLGHFVAMYLDDPGRFFAEDGTDCSLEDAERAGYDVKALLREKAKKEKLAAAQKRINEEFARDAERIAEEAEEEAAHVATGGEQSVDQETSPGGWSMRKTGKRYEVVDAQGVVVETELSREEAEALVEAGRAA